MNYQYISPANTAKELRKALKAAFPGHTFSVRTHVYAGGASINVNYVDGPSQQAVEEVAKSFAGATFDGMTDMKEYHASEHNGETVHWGADFVFVNRDFSQAVREQAEEFTNLAIAEEGGTPSPGWYGEVPQAFLRAAQGAHLRWETSWWPLVSIASAWLVEGRTLIARAA